MLDEQEETEAVPLDLDVDADVDGDGDGAFDFDSAGFGNMPNAEAGAQSSLDMSVDDLLGSFMQPSATRPSNELEPRRSGATSQAPGWSDAASASASASASSSASASASAAPSDHRSPQTLKVAGNPTSTWTSTTMATTDVVGEAFGNSSSSSSSASSLPRPFLPKAASVAEKLPEPPGSFAFFGANADATAALPERTLPPEIKLQTKSCGAFFHLRCSVDLVLVTSRLRCATLNSCRNGKSVIWIRLADPPTTAYVGAGGDVLIASCKAPGEIIRTNCRKIARLIQQAGHPEAKFGGFRFTNWLGSVNVGFPIRLDALAKDWSKNVLYEPEVCAHAVFLVLEPRASFRLYSTGHIIVTAKGGIEDAHRALRKVYLVIKQYMR